MAQDSELTSELARAITVAPGEYRFTVPAARRDNAREVLWRYARRVGTRVRTRTAGDTMWVYVE